MSISIHFKLMPDEKLIECFQFLNAPDLFYSFGQLNYRLSNLPRSNDTVRIRYVYGRIL
jgi:hypothetical protein